MTERAARDEPAATSAATRFFFVSASAAIVVAALVLGRAVLMPLALAALLAFVLDPLVRRLRRWGVPLAFSVTIVVVTTLGVVASLAALGAQQVATLSSDLPTYQDTIQRKLRDLRPADGGNSFVAGASRLVTVIEGEIDAARRALEPRTGTGPAPTRVLVEPAPASPLRALGQFAAPLFVPLATAGLVIVLLAYMLAQRRELSDRLIRLVGGDFHRMAEALNDAARRVSRYLAAQVLVNVGFGAALALGLWVIGVPGAPLWGAIGAALRFVPYLGAWLGAAAPLLLAFAVDPGWSMVLWTLAWIAVLELIINNVVEPMAYGRSTGVSPVAVLLSAAFWALVWGPMGLVLATPLTVCLVVLGRHLGALRFLDVLLGTGPAFDAPTLLYRRLIGGDREEALAMAADEAEASSPREFYSATGVPMLALAAAWAGREASTRQRRRVVSGASAIVAALREDHGGAPADMPRVLCVGARSEFDALSAQMLAHALAHAGVAARGLPAAAATSEGIAQLALDGVDTLVLCTFHAQPQAHARFVSKRLRRRQPRLRIVLAAWALDRGAGDAAALIDAGVDACATTLVDAVLHVQPPEGVSGVDGSEATGSAVAPSAPSYSAAGTAPASAGASAA
jgi:predicted PurR-regulated permease PerM/methylmalonyl-CoA mutase cobalamin-binding subunit